MPVAASGRLRPGGKWYEYPQREFEFYDDPVDDATGKSRSETGQ